MLVRALSSAPRAHHSPALASSTAVEPCLGPNPAKGKSVWALLSVVSLFVLPSNLLFEFGLDVDSPGGNPAMKIRPGTYFALLGAIAALRAMRQPATAGCLARSRVAIAFMVLTAACVLYSVVSVGAAASSSYVDTFIAAGLLAMTLEMTDLRQRRALGYIMLSLVLLSVVLAIWETIRQEHLIPMHIGTVDMSKVQGKTVEEFRAAGLYSHPLTAAIVTSMSVYLSITMRLPIWLSGIVLALLGAGLLSFGGRAALSVTTISLIIAGGTFLSIKIARRGLTLGVIGAALAAIVLLPMFFAVLVTETNLGARIVSTIFFNDNSSEVRSFQWEVLSKLDLRGVLFGTSRAEVELLKSRIGLSGEGNDIENPWLLLFLNLGLIAFIPFVVGLFWFCIDIARRGGWPAGWMLVGSYLVIASGSNSFGVKTADLCFLVAFAFAMNAFNKQLAAESIADGIPEQSANGNISDVFASNSWSGALPRASKAATSHATRGLAREPYRLGRQQLHS
jgi:hypothetical protein